MREEREKRMNEPNERKLPERPDQTRPDQTLIDTSVDTRTYDEVPLDTE